MKRLQIYLDEDLDDALTLESSRTGRSKASLIREYVAARIEPRPTSDPIDSLIGIVPGSSTDSQTIDDTVYSRE